MPFVPDNSTPGLKKDELKALRIKRSNEALNAANIEAARTKKESGFADTIVRLTGMGKTADTFARYGANKMSSPEARQFAPMPTRGEMAGAIGSTALMAFPGSTVAKGVAGAAGKFVGANAAKLAGSVASLGGAGYGFDVSQNLLEGKTGIEAAKPGFGAALGAIPLAGAGASAVKGGIQKIGAKQAPRIINSLIKPLQKDFAYGKNPGRAVAEAGIKANSFEELVTKISQSRQKAGQEIGDLGKKLEGKVVLNLQDTLLPINDAMETAAKQNNATLLQRLNSVKQSITEILGKGVDEAGNPIIVSNGARNLEAASFKDAREMMRSIGDVTAFTGNPSDDKLVNSALKRVYGKMKERTLQGAEAADPAIAKMFRKATEKYSDLTSAEVAAKYRDKILERQNIMSFGQTTVGLGGALATAIATGGAAVPTILAGMGAAGLQKALSSTTFKTRLAAWLAKVPSGEKASLIERFPQLQSIADTRTPGDVFLDSKIGGKLKEGVKSMKGKGGLSIQDVTKQPGYDPLLQEAGKRPQDYASAEEFVKAQGETVYRAGKPFDRSKFTDFGMSVGRKKSTAEIFGGKTRGIEELNISKNAKVLKELPPSIKVDENFDENIVKYAREKGYDVVDISGQGIDEMRVINPDVIKTKSQLIDLYNKAQGTKRGFGSGAGRVKNDIKSAIQEATGKVETQLKGLNKESLAEFNSSEMIQALKKNLAKAKTLDQVESFMSDIRSEIDKVVKLRGDKAFKMEGVKDLMKKARNARSYEDFLKETGKKASDAMKRLFIDSKK